MKIRSSILTFLIIVVNLSFGQTIIENSIQAFVADSDLKHASISFIVLDANSGKQIEEYNSNAALPTASTAKLFSTATALEILTPDYQPITRIYTDGHIDSTGTLIGNLWIRGGGDPSLGSKYFTSTSTQYDFLQSWCDQLEALGIKKIAGAIIADASEFGYNNAPDGWTWGDMGNYYGAGPSGLTIGDNMMNIKFKTSKYADGQTEIVSINPEVPGLEIQNNVKSSTSSSDNAYIYGSPYSLDRFVVGTLPMGKSNFIVKGSLPDPENQFAHKFLEILADNNISTNGFKTVRKMNLDSAEKRYIKYTLLVSHKGPKLIEIINYTNMRSVNLFAEHMLCLVGYEKHGIGTTTAGIKALKQYWKDKISLTGFDIRDGSGLSRSNGISAKHYADLLLAMKGSKFNTAFYNSLPISGVSGTLKSLNRGQTAHGKIHAKSGTMNRIKSYAGYIESSSGKTLIFALIVNNHTCSSSSIKKKMEPLFNSIARY